MNWTDILEIAVIIGAIAYTVGLVRITLYERQINKLHETAKHETASWKGRGVATAIIEAHAKSIHDKYQAQIDELERKRRFILEKLPLFRK